MNMETDREFLEGLGIHNRNIKLFIRGKYLGKAGNAGSFMRLMLVLLLAGSIYALVRAINDWVYGFIIFGFGVFFSLIILVLLIARGQYNKKDTLLIKTQECVNYAVLKSIEFFTKEFSLIDVEKNVEDAFHSLHSRGIELEFEDIKEIVSNYSLDDPEEEIMAEYLAGLLNPVKKNY